MKNNRQAKILEIISTKDIETQFQLLDELKKCGVSTTQATVSRDIKDMHLVKELSPNGIYRYAVSSAENTTNYEAKLKTIFRECVTSVQIAQNIIVVKTLPGLAQAAGSTIDGMAIPHVVGTLCGDDTAFIAMQDTASAQAFCHDIKLMLD